MSVEESGSVTTKRPLVSCVVSCELDDSSNSATGCGVVVGTREPWSCVGVSVRIAVVVVVAAIARNG